MALYLVAYTAIKISGDGSSSSITVNLDLLPPDNLLSIPTGALHSATVYSVTGPTTVNFVSSSHLLSVVTLNFDAAFSNAGVLNPYTLALALEISP